MYACMKGMVVVLYVREYVCYQGSCHIPATYMEKVLLGFSWHMYCADFIENALFKRSGDICLPPLFSLLLGELLVHKSDSDCFISRLLCRSSDSCYNPSLVTVGYQLRVLRFLPLCVLDLLIWYIHVVLLHHCNINAL